MAERHIADRTSHPGPLVNPIPSRLPWGVFVVGAGLIAYALITSAPFVSTGWDLSAFASALFTGLWIVTIGTVGFAVSLLHWSMRREKRKEIQRLEAQLRALVHNPWDVAEYGGPAGERDRGDDRRERIAGVSATREYPATFRIWSQPLLGIALPKAIPMLLASA